MIDINMISERLEIFYFKMVDTIDLPVYVQALINTFLPKIPEMLADGEKQQELLQMLSLMAWVIGYKATYIPEQLGLDGFTEV